jgi:4-amino-4-deoxy-L-arabinose transferase-like glycosyltransferase
LTDCRFRALVGVTYLALGIAVYAGILNTFFVADDFSYLDAIQTSNSPAVIFSPLAERYFRPSVVLVYYLNYQLAGLDSWTYHLSVVLMNACNAWLVFLLGSRLSPARHPIVPALAGLLFLVFGGHAEAVTWIGGMADPLVTLCVLAALLLFLLSLDSARPRWLLIGSWAAFAAALFSKESAAVFPGLALVLGVLSRPALPDRATVRRIVIGLSVPVLLLVTYFLLRKAVLGFTFVMLEGLGTNTNLLEMTRIFVLRSFLPQGPLLSTVVNNKLDMWVLLPLVLILAWFVKRRDFRPLALLGLCFAGALAPVLPLSIAIATPESERLIYMASAFACLLVVWFLDAALRRPWLVAAIVLVCCAGHVAALQRINRNWQEAALVVQETLTTFAQTMREHGRVGSAVYVLNVPDDVRGAYVFRRGFHEALRVAAPDQLATMAQTYVLSVYIVSDIAQPATVVLRGPRTMSIDLGGGWLLGAPAAPTAALAISEWAPQSFVANFGAAADGSLVVYFTPRRTAVVGRLPLEP